MSLSETFPGVVDESVESTELASGTNGFHLEPRRLFVPVEYVPLFENKGWKRRNHQP